MKIVSGFFKVIAFILMTAVVIGLPLVLLGNQVAQPLLNPESMRDLITHDLLAHITTEQIEQRQLPASGNQVEGFVIQLLQHLSHEEWVDFYTLVAPPEIMDGLTTQVVDGVNGWLDGSDADIVISLQPLKANITAQAEQVMTMMLGTLPGCTTDQVLQMAAFAAGLAQEIPLCTPPEPVYSVIFDYGVAQLPSGLAVLPDNYQISIAQFENINPQISRFVGIVRAGHEVMEQGKVVLLLAYLVAIPLGTRSLTGFFRWGGWPSLFTGMHALALGLLLQFSHTRMAERLLSFPSFESLAAIKLPLVSIFDEVLRNSSRPMFIAAAVLILWGVVALTLASVLGRKKAAA